MSVTVDTLTPITGDLYRLTWTGSADLYHVIKNGLAIITTGETEATFSAEDGDVLEVIEDGDTIPAGFPTKARIEWWHVPAATDYVVQEYVGTAWVQRAVYAAGQAFYSYTTRKLEDVTTHNFRVIARDAAGNQSTADEISFLFVRVPDAPQFEYSYANPDLTVSLS